MRISVAVLALVLVALVGAPAALAAKPEREKFQIEETFSENLCGVDVTTHLQVNVNFRVRSDGTAIDTTSVRVTWVDADGDWVSLFVAGRVAFTTRENADGTLTFRAVHSGIHERLRSSEGPLYMDRGRIIFETTVDLGDPEDPEDDVVLSDEIVFKAGPHPQADSGFTLFCDAILSVIE